LTLRPKHCVRCPWDPDRSGVFGHPSGQDENRKTLRSYFCLFPFKVEKELFPNGFDRGKKAKIVAILADILWFIVALLIGISLRRGRLPLVSFSRSSLFEIRESLQRPPENRPCLLISSPLNQGSVCVAMEIFPPSTVR